MSVPPLDAEARRRVRISLTLQGPRVRGTEVGMPELIRSIANRLREYVSDRRRAPRRAVRLAVVVSLVEGRGGVPPTLAGHTCDVSASGLSLILPSIRIGDRYLAGKGQTLRITLHLPHAATLLLYGTAVRYERLEDEDGYVVGVSLADEQGRVALSEFIKTIK